jgi:hypothetical protein
VSSHFCTSLNNKNYYDMCIVSSQMEYYDVHSMTFRGSVKCPSKKKLNDIVLFLETVERNY